MKSPLLAALLALLPIAALRAEDREIQFRTLCVEPVEGIPTVVVPGKTKGKDQAVELYTKISPVVTADFEEGVARFYAEEKGKRSSRLVAEAPLGKSGRQLFVFAPAEDRGKEEGDSPPFRLLCLDDDAGSFPMGGTRVINLAGTTIRCVLGEEDGQEVESGAARAFARPKGTNDYNMYRAKMETQSAEGGAWSTAYAGSWKSTDRRREIAVVQMEPRFKQLVVKVYSDVPPWESP